jgi:anti-sigma B factor antagonist
MNDHKLGITSGPAGAEGASLMKIPGPLVLNNLFEFRDALRAESSSLLVIDLSEVPFVDSAELGSVVNAHVSCVNRGRRLAIVGVNERVGTLLKVTKVDHVLGIYPTLDAALQSKASPSD